MHKKYPYLLRNLKVERVNQVWATDITYIPMPKGLFYLMAVIDLKSRYVIGWSISNTMDAEWCKETMEECVKKHGAPEIVNTDQGSQFTSEVFTSYLLREGIQISMDGKGRAIDNIFIERLWRSVKYENIYLNTYSSGPELYMGLIEYFEFYNNVRRHSSLESKRPVDIFENLATDKSTTAKVNPDFGTCQDQASGLPQAQHRPVLTEPKIGFNQAVEDFPPKEKN